VVNGYNQARQILLVLLLEACARTERRERAGKLISAFEPWKGHLVLVTTRVGLIGPCDHFLGLAYALGERWDDAESMFHSSLGLCERLGYRTWIAHTLLWHGRMLLDRGNDADRDRAAAMLGQALEIAEELGMKLVASDAAALLASM
jgi:hypothetical protein